MKKKGFTLIELLAVIVILAIIALIATPLVLKYIEKSRKESKVDSAYSFVRNLETEMANYSIKHNGNKYNKAPIGGDYYEFKDFDTDNEIDTKVKGDNPENIKLCLSSLGLVEKGVFQYGNYYVSYDGKKGSITDEPTYNNFSCSGSVAGAVNEEIFDISVTIEKVGEGKYEEYVGVITDIKPFEYDDEHYYNLYIDGIAYKSLFGIINADGYKSADLFGKYPFLFGDLNGEVRLQGYDETSLGTYQIKLEKTTEEVYPHSIKVGKNLIYVISRNLQAVDTTIIVKDDKNNVLVEESYAGSDIEDLSAINYLTFSTKANGAYEIIQQGRTIIVEIKQVIDGQTVITTLGGSPFIKSDDTYEGAGSEPSDSYYWGNELVPVHMEGS